MDSLQGTLFAFDDADAKRYMTAIAWSYKDDDEKAADEREGTCDKADKLIHESSLRKTPVLLFFLDLFSRSLLLIYVSLMLNNKLQLPHAMASHLKLLFREE